jgi:hypothetical protein
MERRLRAFLLRGRVARSWMWAAAMPAVFGAFGAITFMALSGVLLDRLRAATPSPRHVPPTV